LERAHLRTLVRATCNAWVETVALRPCSINLQSRATVMAAMAASFMRPQSRAKAILVAVAIPGGSIAAAATAAMTDVLLLCLAVPPILLPFVVPSTWVARAKSGATQFAMD
jgi:hypothetical protein